MKYEDIIKEFQSLGKYEVSVHLSSLEMMIESYIEDFNLELNPDFQRGNVWTEEQQIAYVEFILRGGTSAKTIYFNCPWFNDFEKNKYDMDMVCIDGLQRLTALRKFIANELPVFGHYLKEFDNYKVLLRSRMILFNVNDLKTREEVLQWYIDYNSGGTIHSIDEINRVKKLLEDEKLKNK